MHLRIAAPSAAPASSRAKWLFFFSFLTLFCILDSIHDFIARLTEGGPVDVLKELQGSLVYWGPYLALVPLVIALVNRYPPRLQRPASIALHVVAGLLFTYVVVMILTLILPEGSYYDAVTYWARFFLILKVDFALVFAFYSMIVVSASLLRQYDDLKEREVRASQLETGLAQTRLQAIEAQLNPHFFFNTLQAISVMALAGERDGVVEVVSRLSSLLRVSFDKHRPPLVTLADEMAFVEGYVAIQQLCFGQRLTVTTEIAPETVNAYVPTMLLQPLVENAFVHGIAVTPGKGVIRITCCKCEDELVIQVADSGPGFQTREPVRSGVGLSVTESRLKLHFDGNHSIEYGRSDLGGANVKVCIAFTHAAPQRLHIPSGIAA